MFVRMGIGNHKSFLHQVAQQSPAPRTRPHQPVPIVCVILDRTRVESHLAIVPARCTRNYARNFNCSLPLHSTLSNFNFLFGRSHKESRHSKTHHCASLGVSATPLMTTCVFSLDPCQGNRDCICSRQAHRQIQQKSP